MTPRKEYVVIVKVDDTGREYQSTIGTLSREQAEVVAMNERADARRFGQFVTVTIRQVERSA